MVMMMHGTAIAVDGSGNAYVTGDTLTPSTTMLHRGLSRRRMEAFGRDVFVTKLNATGTALVYSTYIGGSGED
jgi:hypothetical protein